MLRRLNGIVKDATARRSPWRPSTVVNTATHHDTKTVTNADGF
jgi:hypothetical protein